MAEVTRDPATTSSLSEYDVSEIQRLHKERSELKLRLQKLDEKKSAAKPEIVEKVRKDYQVKLEQVESTLEQKSSGLKNELVRLEDERKGILQDKGKIDDAMEELELRHLVGEFAPDLKDTLEESKVQELQKIVGRIEELEAKISTVSQLLNPDLPPPDFEKITVPEKTVKSTITTQAAEADKEAPVPVVEIQSSEKVIKCPTCGTPNRHDNWYCEKCGRELLGSQL